MKNQQWKNFLITLAAIFIAGASLTYGALTAPHSTQQSQPSQSAQPPKKEVKNQPKNDLESQLPIITAVITSAYPKVASDYTMIKPQLYEQGKWFGAVLQYRGTDITNRDTLRVLVQKKGDVWTLRTTPPEMLLSAKKYPDVPKSVLVSLNKAVGLP